VKIANVLAAVAWLLLAVGGNAIGGEKTFVLKDHIDKDWGTQLVHYPVEFRKGQCHAASLSLECDGRPVAFQLSDVTYGSRAKRFVKSAKLWFITRISKLQEKKYVLTWGTKPRRTEKTPTDLVITAKDAPRRVRDKDGPGSKHDYVTFVTKRFGVRLITGKYKGPDIPPPVIGFRTKDGKWFGGSELFGSKAPVSLHAVVTGRGPVFGEVSYTYTYDDKSTLKIRARLAAGDDAAFFDTESSKHHARRGFNLHLNRGLGEVTVNVFKEIVRHKITPKLKSILGEPRDRKKPMGRFYPAPLDAFEPGVLHRITPFEEWWDTQTRTLLRLSITGTGTDLVVGVVNPADYVEPVPRGQKRVHHEKPGLGTKQLPIHLSADGHIFIHADNAMGKRNWTVGQMPFTTDDYFEPGVFPDKSWNWSGKRHREGESYSHVGRRMDVVKHYVLDWQDKPGVRHPRLFMQREDLEKMWREAKLDQNLVKELLAVPDTLRVRKEPSPNWGDYNALGVYLLSKGDPKVARKLKLRERLLYYMHHEGNGISGQGQLGGHLCLYDAIFDSGMFTEREKKVLRAQMAYTGYVANDPGLWDRERQYASGNENMTVTRNMGRGFIACLIPDHPEARKWAQKAIDYVDHSFIPLVGKNGAWMESRWYSDVTLRAILRFAITARNAGFKDYFKEGTVKRMLLFLAKVDPPNDPLKGNIRRGAHLGRATGGFGTWATFGMAAAVESKNDPDFAKVMQWHWRESGFNMGSGVVHQFAGWHFFLLNKDRPRAVPDWTSEHFPKHGVLLRQGVGGKHESYIDLVTFRPEGWYLTYPSATGAISMMFLRGMPIGGRGSYGYERAHELLTCSVLPARQRDEDVKTKWGGPNSTHARTAKGLSYAFNKHFDYVDFDSEIGKTRPRAGIPEDYFATVNVAYRNPKAPPQWPPLMGKPGGAPIQWKRQLAFVKGASPKDACYVVFRDTVSGGQPTMWQYWTLSEKIGTPEEVRNRKRFLADKPGANHAPPRQLKGDRFTALGQADVDVEYFIAAPKETPRHTLRHGDHLFVQKFEFSEFQDCMHLQLAGDGYYYVVMYARLPNEPVPEFSTLADGSIIKVTSDFGTDFNYLSDRPGNVQAGNVAFQGKAGSIQDRKDGLALSLGTKGKVSYKQYAVAADGAAALRVTGSKLVVSLPPDHDLRHVALTAPGTWRLGESAPEAARIVKSGGSYKLSIPAGVRNLSLQQ